MRFLITGCSRSGTQYAARLWSALGVPCGHESLFNIFSLRPGDPAPRLGDPSWVGDSSFLAVPFLETLPPGTVVLHQLRQPLDVIRSHVGIHFFSALGEGSPYLAENHRDFLGVIERCCPEIFLERDECARCARYWVRWNQLAERAGKIPGLDYLRYRVEDLDRRFLERVLARIGIAVPRERIEAALRAVPHDENHRPRDESIALAQIRPGALRDAFCELSRRYGYRVDPVSRGSAAAAST